MMKRFISLFLAAFIFMLSPGFSRGDTEYHPAGSPLEGYIKDISAQKVTVEQYDGRVSTLAFTSGTLFKIDNLPASWGDFRAGMEVYILHLGQNVTYMEGYSTETPGYIPPGGKVRSGVVKKIDRNQIIIKLATGREETYFTSPATIALKNGRNVPLSTLYEGDSVRFFFDEADSTIISRISIQGDSIKVKALYRGTLQVTDKSYGRITLNDVKVLTDGTWKDVESVMQFQLSDDVGIFTAGSKIPLNNLKYFRGKTAYLAARDFFGKDRIYKMVIKNQSEIMISDKIEDINWYFGAFELSNKKNISFNDGTIFIKNGRIIDKYSINPDSDALIVADGRGSQNTADVVYVYNEAINNSNIGQNFLFAGRLDEIVENQLTLTDFFILNRNEWESFDEDKKLYFDDDTYFYDLEEKKEISRKEFYSKDYAVDEKSDYAKDKGLKDWYGYMYTDGDRIVAVAVKKRMDSLLRQRITAGTVESVEDDPMTGITITVKDARDWSSRKNQWMPKNQPVRMGIDTALVIKENNIISYQDVKPGDIVYSVRDDFYCKILLIK